MSLAPIAVVVGSTGKQGTGVVQSLLKAGKFHVKALSRDPSSAGMYQYCIIVCHQLQRQVV